MVSEDDCFRLLGIIHDYLSCLYLRDPSELLVTYL